MIGGGNRLTANGAWVGVDRHAAMAHILVAPAGAVLAVEGLSLAALRAEIEACEPAAMGARRLLLVPLPAAATAEAAAGALLSGLADLALKLWPHWYGDAPLPSGAPDTLGRLAAASAVRRAAGQVGGALLPWAEAAAQLALMGRPPLVPHTPAATQLQQLACLIAPQGLAIALEIPPALEPAPAATLVHVLEWTARNLAGVVAALFPQAPLRPGDFERIRQRGLRVAAPGEGAPVAGDGTPPSGETKTDVVSPPLPWLLPWRGCPHPLSAIETRVARLLAADAELGPLFHFNQPVETVRGSRPRVDLLWREGRLVVELDGYADHGTRAAFGRDRHRDFELTLSGYTVLRLPNDEIAQDCWLALEKIRDLVRYRRQVLPQEGTGG